jgi:hypothetical protein
MEENGMLNLYKIITLKFQEIKQNTIQFSVDVLNIEILILIGD